MVYLYSTNHIVGSRHNRDGMYSEFDSLLGQPALYVWEVLL